MQVREDVEEEGEADDGEERRARKLRRPGNQEGGGEVASPHDTVTAEEGKRPRAAAEIVRKGNRAGGGAGDEAEREQQARHGDAAGGPLRRLRFF